MAVACRASAQESSQYLVRQSHLRRFGAAWVVRGSLRGRVASTKGRVVGERPGDLGFERGEWAAEVVAGPTDTATMSEGRAEDDGERLADAVHGMGASRPDDPAPAREPIGYRQ